MLAAVKGINFPDRKKQKQPVDWDRYVIPGSKRGKDVEVKE